jgi:hypothetical protein
MDRFTPDEKLMLMEGDFPLFPMESVPQREGQSFSAKIHLFEAEGDFHFQVILYEAVPETGAKGLRDVFQITLAQSLFKRPGDAFVWEKTEPMLRMIFLTGWTNALKDRLNQFASETMSGRVDPLWVHRLFKTKRGYPVLTLLTKNRTTSREFEASIGGFDAQLTL